MTNNDNKLVDVDFNGVLSNVDLENADNVKIITAALEKSAEWNGLSSEQREAYMQNPKEGLIEIAHKTGMAAVYANSSLEGLREELEKEPDHPDKEGFGAMIEVAIALDKTFPFGIEITSEPISPSTTPNEEILTTTSSPERK